MPLTPTEENDTMHHSSAIRNRFQICAQPYVEVGGWKKLETACPSVSHPLPNKELERYELHTFEIFLLPEIDFLAKKKKISTGKKGRRTTTFLALYPILLPVKTGNWI
ncbi:hypothetical protein NPIL_597761 [Nephila pilipes]|uniref:Uncharacterized protein n=1 Tax=Nephila pilipes TaxID=299642 RepID=A0A8X6KJA4_NEPPI|nr:hypothetical protein NPIL_597761 [Nephila pilipes]